MNLSNSGNSGMLWSVLILLSTFGSGLAMTVQSHPTLRTVLQALTLQTGERPSRTFPAPNAVYHQNSVPIILLLTLLFVVTGLALYLHPKVVVVTATVSTSSSRGSCSD